MKLKDVEVGSLIYNPTTAQVAEVVQLGYSNPTSITSLIVQPLAYGQPQIQLGRRCFENKVWLLMYLIEID